MPPVFSIYFITSFLCLLNLLHLNIKLSVVCSSSSHGPATGYVMLVGRPLEN